MKEPTDEQNEREFHFMIKLLREEVPRLAKNMNVGSNCRRAAMLWAWREIVRLRTMLGNQGIDWS